MAQHFVTCVYCKERFDRDKEPTEQISARRYAHKKCHQKYEDEISSEEKDYYELEQYIMKLFSKDYLTAKIRKQIKDYHKEYGYTFSGMLKTLKWWYEVKGNDKNKANEGIGIIPFVYNQAETYYYNIYLANESNKNINLKHIIKEIEIPLPQINVSPQRLFKFSHDLEVK